MRKRCLEVLEKKNYKKGDGIIIFWFLNFRVIYRENLREICYVYK